MLIVETPSFPPRYVIKESPHHMGVSLVLPAFKPEKVRPRRQVRNTKMN